MNKNLKFRAIAVDLDGTLLNSDHQLHPDHKETLIELHHQGVHVLMASGRSKETIVPVWEELGIDGHIIAYNGTCMYSCQQGKITPLQEDLLPEELVEKAIRIGTEKQFFMNFYGNDRLEGYQPQGDFHWGEKYANQTKAVYDIQTSDSQQISRKNVIKILMICEPDKRDSLVEELKPLLENDFQITCSNPEFIELLPKEKTKGNMLQAWCDMQKISPEEVVAFGDAENDYEMLSLVGYGIAANNATPGLKAKHPNVSQWTNDEGFIAKEVAAILSTVP